LDGRSISPGGEIMSDRIGTLFVAAAWIMVVPIFFLVGLAIGFSALL